MLWELNYSTPTHELNTQIVTKNGAICLFFEHLVLTYLNI